MPLPVSSTPNVIISHFFWTVAVFSLPPYESPMDQGTAHWHDHLAREVASNYPARRGLLQVLALQIVLFPMAVRSTKIGSPTHLPAMGRLARGQVLTERVLKFSCDIHLDAPCSSAEQVYTAYSKSIHPGRSRNTLSTVKFFASS